uniref:Retrovirus-related Pol polyprotein from transposon TNT 1-94 n=1 Tax=Tanacetum cinerariifolium TaxID=118510 RepID=A0A6L2M212_TANCI|nr:retrovirus-related Pol polyprotein from transposon TNT 1-94 [Tanacetum cinerariifolium]
MFENEHTCTACLKGKQHKASSKSKLVNSATKPIHTLHMDLFCPTYVSSISHKWYCLVVTDDFSRFTWTFFLKTKDETSGILRKFITEIENLKDLKVKIIRCDNRGEFRNKEMDDFCSQKGIKREFSNARTPQQNGIAQRRNRTLIEAARTMLADAKLPVTFWAEAVNTAYQLGKFKAKGDEGFFIGYSMFSKAFRVFNKRTKRVEENLHVDFLENKAIEKGTNSTNFSSTKDFAGQEVKKDVSSLRHITLPNWVHDALLESSSSNAQDSCKANAPESSGNPNPTATSTNLSTNQLETLTVESPIPTVSLSVLTACLNDSPEPSNPSWVEAIQDELLQFKIQNVWTLVDCPKGEEGINYDEVFAPVARIKAIRLFLAYALFMGFTVYQMDVKSAFLYGTIDEEVYVIQPPRFQDPEYSASVYKVEKAMYGLHQAPRAWYEFKALMHEKFQMSAMGELNFFLGLQVLHKEDGIFLSQDKYVGDILKKFRYSEVRSSNTPMDKENPWGKERTGKDVDLHLYRSMIRSLMYLTASRPDIIFTFYACARHQVTPKEYSDYGGATQDHNSTTGGCQFLGRRLISWQCKKQTIVATLTTEAEYVAAASFYGQVLWI